MTIVDFNDGRKNNFDFLRMVAALLVITSHAYPLSGSKSGDFMETLTNGEISLGRLGVIVFFVISGFLISQSWVRKPRITIFVKSRLLRLFPGALVAVLLTVFMLGPLITKLSVKDYFVNVQTYNYLTNAFLIKITYNLPGVFEANSYQNVVNGSLWTIPIEIKCYLVVLVLGIVKMLRFKWVNFLLCFGSLLLGIVHHNDLLLLFTFFAAGMAFYAFKDVILIHHSWLIVSLLALMILNYYQNIQLGTVFLAYLIFYLSFSPQIRLWSFGKYGDFSYGTYIYAFPIQQLITMLCGGVMNPYLNMLITIPLVLLLAVLSWYLIEKPCLAWKNATFLTKTRVG
jgi:peptidoglycan/LPS O-acetylase OafA/YrhL